MIKWNSAMAPLYANKLLGMVELKTKRIIEVDYGARKKLIIRIDVMHILCKVIWIRID